MKTHSLTTHLTKCLLLVSGAMLLSLSAKAQEEIAVPAVFNTLLQSHPNQKMLRSRVDATQAKSGDLLQLPFVDDFSGDHFPGNTEGRKVLWTSRNATRNFTRALNPPTLGVVTFDGADEVGYPYNFSANAGTGPADTLSSLPIDLGGNTASDQIGISFYFQPKGRAIFGPQSADSLRLEFYAPELEQWFWVWSTVNVSSPEEFTFVYIPISNARYLKPGFRFRFINWAALQGAFSPWHIDYVRIDRNNINLNPIVDDIAFVRQEHTLLNGLSTMPRHHFAELSNPSSLMRDDISLRLSNLSNTNRTLVGNQLRVLDNGMEQSSFANPNSPAILAQSTLEYTHPVKQAPHNFTFSVPAGQGPFALEVQCVHAVSDFDLTASNDTMRFEQRFFTNYGYDDGSAEWGWAATTPTGGAQVAMQYTSFKADSLFGVQIYTMPLSYNYENTTFTIKVWEDTGNGPGAEVASALRQVDYGRDAFQQSIIYAFNEPVLMPAGSFFVGYQQSNQAEGIAIGLDMNTAFNQQKLWFKFPSTSWTPSTFQGTVMIQPMFTAPGWNEVTHTRSHQPRRAALGMYPNPATAEVRFQLNFEGQARVYVYDLSGRMVYSQSMVQHEALTLQGMAPGMYLVHLHTANGDHYSDKLIIKH